MLAAQLLLCATAVQPRACRHGADYRAVSPHRGLFICFSPISALCDRCRGRNGPSCPPDRVDRLVAHMNAGTPSGAVDRPLVAPAGHLMPLKQREGGGGGAPAVAAAVPAAVPAAAPAPAEAPAPAAPLLSPGYLLAGRYEIQVRGHVQDPAPCSLGQRRRAAPRVPDSCRAGPPAWRSC